MRRRTGFAPLPQDLPQPLFHPRAHPARLPVIRSRMNSATGLASGPALAHRADTGRAPVIAGAAGDELARAGHQLVVHRKQRLAEPDAARVVVVDEHARLVQVAQHEPSLPRRSRRRRRATAGPSSPAPIEIPMSCRSHISRSCATCRIAKARPDDAVAPVLEAVRQRRHHLPRQREPLGTTWCASAARAGRARRCRRSRWCRT